MAIPSKPGKQYFLVRSLKLEEKNKKEMLGERFYAPVDVAMTRNLQHGEIIAIGEKAHESFPEAKIGHTIIMHHLVQNKGKQQSKESHLIDEDEKYHYYVVTPIGTNGKRNEVYGVWDGEKIITHPEFLLLENEEPVNGAMSVDKFIEAATKKTDNGLYAFKEWRESRDEKQARLAKIKAEVQELTSKNTLTPQIQAWAAGKEEEMAKISMELNQNSYDGYKIAALNPQLSDWFNRDIKVGDTMYVLSKATDTKIDFMGKTYRTANTQFVGYMIDN